MSLIPFFIELILDFLLIRSGRKDMHWGFRFPMFVAVSLTYSDMVLHFDTLVSCLIPYLFFDIILNKLRGKDWDYLNKTKFWDRNLVRLNPWFLLVLRFLAAFIIGFVVIKWL